MTVLNSDRLLSVTAKHKEIYVCVFVFWILGDINVSVLLFRSQK